MTVIQFPSRHARYVRTAEQAIDKRRREVMDTQRAAATLAKSGLTMWLMPSLFCLTMLDRMSRDDGEQ